MLVNQFREFASAVIRQLPSDMSGQQMQAYIENQAKLAAVLRKGLMPVDEIIEHELLLGPDVVSRNVREAGYEGYVNPAINDDNYPVSGEGIVKVRFKKISGELFKRGENGYCYREDFQRYCRENGLREPNAAEATLPHAKDKQLGRGNCPTVAFIGGSRAAFLVLEDAHARSLGQYIDDDLWNPRYVFLAVSE